MTTRSQFCPVAKAAEVFGDRWIPIIIRELCFGTRSFGELLEVGTPYIADSAGSASQAT
jgi:DNA-binding HxlR family transcriptional regulator